MRLKKIKDIKIVDSGSPCDIDTDFHTEGRKKVIQYVIDKYGKENVASLITKGLFKSKNSWKSMCKTFGVPFEEANRISKLFPDQFKYDDFDFDEDLEDSDISVVGKEITKELVPVYESAKELVGRQRETGVHACFTGDTLITTKQGIKYIKDVTVKDEVLTHLLRFMPVVNVIKKIVKEVYCIKLNQTETYVTPNHLFYVRSMENGFLSLPRWKKTEDFNIHSDYVGSPLLCNNFKDSDVVEFGVVWRKLSKKTLIKKEVIVYDLTVLNDSSYIANGMIVHNCGIVISKEHLSDTIPMIIRQDDNMPVTGFTYQECESLGLIKMDFLGLDTLDIIQQTVKNIKYTKELDLDIFSMLDSELNDKKTFELFQKGETVGVFQFGRDFVRDILKQVKPTTIDHLSAITALCRPGPMAMNAHTEFINRVNGTAELIPVDKSFYNTKVEEILKPSASLLVFQEQIMKIAMECANFTPKEADNLRKAIGKKKMDLMLSLGDKFKQGMIKNGYNPEAVNVLWEGIVGFGEYSFNKSHSYSYSLNSYLSAYLKAHYSVEWISAVLRQRIDDNKKRQEMMNECRRMKIPFIPPDINLSFYTVAPSKDSKSVLFGLSGIKGIGTEIAKQIIEERSKGLFLDIEDFVKRTNKYVKENTLETLALAGCFDCFGISRKSIVENSKKLIRNSQVETDSNMLFNIKVKINLPKEEYSHIEKIQKETEKLGIPLSGNLLDNINVDKPDLNNIGEGTYIVYFSEITKKNKNNKISYMVTMDNGISTRDIWFNKSLSENIKEEPLKNTVYKVKIEKSWNSLNIVDFQKIDISENGKIIYKIKVKKEFKNEVIKKLQENKGTDVIRVFFEDNSYIDINNVQFLKGTTFFEVEQWT